MTVPRRLSFVLSASLFLVQFSTVINGQCLGTEMENPVLVTCFNVDRLDLCLAQGSIMGTIRAILSSTCSKTINLDLTVKGLKKDEVCVATAVDCVMEAVTGGVTGDNDAGLIDLIKVLLLSKREGKGKDGGKGYMKPYMMKYHDIHVPFGGMRSRGMRRRGRGKGSGSDENGNGGSSSKSSGVAFVENLHSYPRDTYKY